MANVIPHLWMDDNINEAVEFYKTLFPNSKTLRQTHYSGIGEEIHGKKSGELMTLEFELAGEKFVALNGGPHYVLNPSVSLFVTFASQEELDLIWEKLMVGGQALMPLGQYEWSSYYGWLQDKYGLTWQLYLGGYHGVEQQILPSFLFANEYGGRAQEAIEFYTSIFSPSKIIEMALYKVGEDAPEGALKHGLFHLENRALMAIDSHIEHPFQFNEAFSLLIECENQKEIDHYWNLLSKGGDPKAQRCGWLKDKFGVSWQVSAKQLPNWLNDHASPVAKSVMSAMMQMKKINISELANLAKEEI